MANERELRKQREELDKKLEELNKIKVNESMTQEGDEGSMMLLSQKTNTYRFLENDERDLAYGKAYTVSRLFEEFRRVNQDEENAELNDAQAEKLAKKNAKYSAKDRKKSLAKSKKIRTKQMENVTFEDMMGHGILKDKEKLELEKKYIELDAEAREEYIKAYMTDEDKYAVDLSMNKMRKYYRLIRMYVSHSVTDKVSVKTLTSYQNEIKKLRTKLDKEMKEVRKYKGYGKYFSWEKVTGHVKERKKVTAQENIARDDAKVGRIEEERQTERQRFLDKVEARKQMVITGKYIDENGAEQQLDTEWPLSEFSDVINNEIFTEKQHTIFSDDRYRSKIIDYNNNVKDNLKALNKKAVGFMAKSLNAQLKNQKGKDLYIPFLEAGIPWVKKYCIDLQKKMFGKALLSWNSVNDVMDDERKVMALEADMIKPLKKAAGRWAILKDADFYSRGIDIGKSKALMKILGPDEETKDIDIKKEDLINMVRHAQGTDRLLHRMVVDKFGKFAAEDIYKDLRKFIGDKALFANNRIIKDYAERYLNGLALTNRNIAQKQKAFDDAYKEKITGPFAEAFKPAIEKYLLTQATRWNVPGKYKEGISKELNIVVLFLKGFEQGVEGESLSQEGWRQLIKDASKYMYNNLHILMREKDDVMIKGFAQLGKNSIQKILEKDNGQEKMSCYEYLGKKKRS